MSRFSRSSVRARVALLTMVVFTVLLVIVGVAVYISLGRSLRAELDRSLLDQAAVVRDAIDAGDTAIAGPGLAERLDEADRAIQLFDVEGRLLQAVGDNAEEPLLESDDLAAQQAEFSNRSSDDDNYRVLTVPGHGETGIGAVLVASETDEIVEAQNQLLTVFVPIGLVALVLAGTGGWLVARRALVPLQQMAADTRSITGGDLAQRVSVPSTGDEVAQLGATVNQMLERVADSIDRERAFTADASHELRTPLAILRSELELAQRQHTVPDPALESALEETDRLASLVEDLLVLARSDRQHPDTVHGPTDLGDLAADACHRFAALASERGISLTHRGAAVIHGDARSLERALANLLGNALRYTPDAGHITVTSTPQETGATVSVADSGPGVPPDELPHLFERFTRGDPARPQGGAGLGLAIVRAVARAHGGHAEAANAPDGGLVVTMHLRGDA